MLDHYIKPAGLKGVLLKVTADQLFFAPIFLIVFLGTMGTLNGETLVQITNRIKKDFSEILVTNWKVTLVKEYGEPLSLYGVITNKNLQ